MMMMICEHTAHTVYSLQQCSLLNSVECRTIGGIMITIMIIKTGMIMIMIMIIRASINAQFS